jgi:hypothetical protein
MFHISLLDQGDSLARYALVMQAASLHQEETDSVAGSAITHLLTGLSQLILLEFPPSVEFVSRKPWSCP